MGDVDINLGSENDEMGRDVTLRIMPGTIIHGKLTYRSVTEAEIASEAQINAQQWVRANEYIRDEQTYSPNYLSKVIKTIFTTALYFLIGLLLFKLFPSLTRKYPEIIERKPWAVIGAGAACLLSPIAILIVVVLSLILSAWILSPSIGFITALVFTAFYTFTLFLSTIPVSLWLGNKLFKDRFSTVYRFGLGLILITAVTLLLNLLSALPGAGGIFGLVSFVLTLIILLLGTGAFIYGIISSPR